VRVTPKGDDLGFLTSGICRFIRFPEIGFDMAWSREHNRIRAIFFCLVERSGPHALLVKPRDEREQGCFFAMSRAPLQAFGTGSEACARNP